MHINRCSWAVRSFAFGQRLDKYAQWAVYLPYNRGVLTIQPGRTLEGTGEAPPYYWTAYAYRYGTAEELYYVSTSCK